MISPCFTAMLHQAIIATNPPVGLSPVTDAGSDTTAQINPIFASLPYAIDGNTKTRNVFFRRPTTRYKIGSVLNITADGTTVMCGGGPKVTLDNVTTSYYGGDDPWFRGSSVAGPMVRMQNVEHVTWHGGGWKGRDSQSGGAATQTIYEMGTTRFCVVSNMYSLFKEHVLQVNGLNAGEFAEFCLIRDCEAFGGDTSLTRVFVRIGQLTTGAANNGKARLCGISNFYTAGGSPNGPVFSQAVDCWGMGGTSEFNTIAYVLESGCLRFTGIQLGRESTSPNMVCPSGASATTIGSTNFISNTGTGDGYDWGSGT